MSIGNRLNEAMTRAGFKSQSALSRASGIPQPTINRILKGGGKKGPETVTIQKLAVATRVSFAWLHEGIDEGGQDDDIAAIVMMLKQLEGRDRTLIRGKIEAWVEMMLGNIPDANRRENTNLDRRNGTK